VAINQFVPFAAQPGANVVTQSSYAADPTTGMGFSSGIALSAKLNKVWRQSSFVSAGVAELVSRLLNQDVLDDGNLTNFVQKLEQALISMRPKQVLMSPITNFYVSATRGSDFSTGVSTAEPWQTLQHAINTVTNNLDFNMQSVVINVEDGNYTPFVCGTIPSGMFGRGSQQLTMRGNVANPGAVRIISQTSSCVMVQAGSQLHIEGFHLESRGVGPWEGCAVIANGLGHITFQAIDFGGCANTHIFSGYDGFCAPVGNYTISGGAMYHLKASGCGEAGRTDPMIVSIIGNIEFTGAFIQLDGLSYIMWDAGNISFSGAGNVTGKKHQVFSNSVLQVPNGTINYFPGTLAGSVPAQPNTATAGGSGGLFMTDWPGVSRTAFNHVDMNLLK